MYHICSIIRRTRPHTWGWVHKAFPWTRKEGMAVVVERQCYAAPEDCRLLTGHMHQPDRTQQHVSFPQSIHPTQSHCGILPCTRVWKDATADQARSRLLPSFSYTGVAFDTSSNCSLKACSCKAQAVWQLQAARLQKRGRKQAQRFSKQAGSPNYTKSFWCSYNLDIMCYTPEYDIPQSPVRWYRQAQERNRGQYRCTLKYKLLWILLVKHHSLTVE